MFLTSRQVGDSASDRVCRGEMISRELAESHYENFAVAARFLPRHIKQDLFNIYAFCRLADDFADELIDINQSQAALDRWEKLLDAAANGNTDDPLFCALGETIRRRRLSVEPFHNLLSAFRLDLVKKRYRTWSELRDYTRLSADPVGHIVLEIYDQRNPDFFALSDKICTALQLANHLQDVAEDWKRGRIYLPQEDLEKFNVTESMIAEDCDTEEFRHLMAFEVDRARELFKEGYPLLNEVDRKLAPQLALYWWGGMKALEIIEKIDYNVLNRSAKLQRIDKIKVAARSLSWLIPV